MSESEVREPAATAGGAATSPAGLVVAAVGGLLLARLVAASLLELGPDEAYYLLWSRNLSWSYYDHPPMAAWWIAAGTALFGDSPFGIRFFSSISSIPISLAVYGAGRALFDDAVARRAVLWTNATLLLSVGGLLATPDAPAVLFWALATWAFARVAATGRGSWWLLVGLFAGLGVISKLTDLFLGPGILLCLLVRRDLRHWFASPWLWAGGLVAAAVCAPMILWNSAHDWITFTKQFSRISTGAFQPEKFPEFLLTQFAVLNPLVAIFAGLAVAVWVKRRPAATGGRIGVLMWTAAPLVAYMAVHSFQEQIQGHWLAPAFPTLALAAAAAAEAGGRRWAPLAALAFPVGAILALLAFVAAVNPGGAIPYRLDVAQVNRGWDSLAAEAEALREKSGAGWIAATHYGVGAELAYHLSGKAKVVAIFERARYAFAPAPDPGLLTMPVMIVSDVAGPGPFTHCFAEVRPAGTLPRRSGGETIETYFAYLAGGAAAGLFDPGCDRLAGR